MATYMDFNILNGDFIENKVITAYDLGYDTVAINNIVLDLLEPKVKGKKKGQQQVQIKRPDKVKVDESVLSKFKKGRRMCKQLARFSTVLTDVGQTKRLSDPDVQCYDLIAVQPNSEKTFHLACSTLDVDIITIDVTQRLPYYIKHTAVNVAIERGIHFEIQYAPAVRDSTLRRWVICNAQSLMYVCKGKNVILSSGCERTIELRGPHDVANLGLLFGMTEAQAKAAVGRNCRAVLCHAESRKAEKSVIAITRIPSKTQDDQEHKSSHHKQMDTSSPQSDQSGVPEVVSASPLGNGKKARMATSPLGQTNASSPKKRKMLASDNLT